MIQTVTGTILSEQLGVTSLHEHIICGAPVFYYGFGEKWATRERIIEDAVIQLKEASKRYQLRTIVDGTPFSLSRDILLLKAISEKAGVNIIASTGYYVTVDYGLHEIAAEIQAEYFIEECNHGIGKTGIRPGFLKCATNADTSLRSIEIMAMVQRETQLPLFAHSDALARTGFKQLEIFERYQLNPKKIIIGHTGDTHDRQYVVELLKHGCFICIDRLYWPDDIAAKAHLIVQLAEQGWLDRITVAHDHICWKMSRNRKQKERATVAPPPENSLNNIGDQLIPELRKFGFGNREIEQLLIVNPIRVFE